MAETKTHNGAWEERTESLSTSEWHRILQDDLRRATLDALTTLEMPASLEHLAEAILTAETELSSPDGGEAKDRLMITLQHVHLPMLADSGLIQYDPVDRRIQAVRTDRILARLNGG